MDQITPENNHPRRNRQSKKPSRKMNWLRFTTVILTVIFVMSCGVMAAWAFSMPKFNPNELEGAAASTLYDKDGNAFTTLHAGENRLPVKLSEVPKDLQQAVLAAEDIRFYEHFGISIPDIFRALWANVTNGFGSQGASTITQQLVKLSFLTPEKTFKRKFQEIILTLQVERQYTKDEILELYLNKIFYSQGATGIKMAALTYFDKDLKDLTLGEKAILAGLPNWPSKWDPIKHPENGEERKAMVLDNMVKYGFVSQAEAEKAKAEPLKPKLTKANTAAAVGFPYFRDYVIDQAEELELTDTQLYQGGLNIYTTVDPKIQAAAEAAMSDPKNFPASKPDQLIQGAITVLDTSTGQVRAIVGGREHTTERGFNRATDLKRQPGSTFKPIAVYGPAIENGYGPATVLDDVPSNWGSYAPGNSDGKFHGLITMRAATKASINIYAVKMLNKVGIEKGFTFAQKLGIQNLSQSDKVLGLGLGGLTTGTNPLDMAAAYAAFGNRGVYNKPVVITKITDSKGNVLIDLTKTKSNAKPVMKETTAYLMSDVLKSVVDEPGGTGGNASFGGRPIAGKTGTTELPPNLRFSRGNKDAWFAGYTPQYTGVVWMGYDITDQNHIMVGEYGGVKPAGIWKQVMIKAHEGLPVKDFDKPAGITSVVIDDKTGTLPGPLTPDGHRVEELFTTDTVPTETSNIWFQTADGVKFKRPDPYTGDKFIEDSGEELPSGAAVTDSQILDPTKTTPSLTAPGNLQATIRNGTKPQSTPSVLLTWSGSAPTYRVYRSSNSDFTPSPNNLIADKVTNSSYEDKTVDAKKTYYYKVLAIDGTKVSSPSLAQVIVPASE